MKKIRIIFSIPLSQDAKNEVNQITSILKKNSPLTSQIDWIDQDKYHINVVTFGIIPEDRMHMASEILSELVAKTDPMNLAFGNVSYFYKSKSGESQIFIDIQDKERLLRQFFNTLRNTLGENEYYPPERLHPHIVLGIVDKKRHTYELKDTLATIGETETPIGMSFVVDRIGVYESIEKYDASARLKPINIYKMPILEKGKDLER